jgi:hypothetical protein
LADAAGFAERGTGSHRRRCAIVEKHVGSNASTIFASAVEPVTGQLHKLRADCGALLSQELVSNAMAQQRLHYGTAWEDVTADTREARATLRPRVADTMSQARQALLQLRKAQGDVAPVFESAAKAAADGDGDDDDDDDEVMVVQAPKKEIEVVEIDLDEDEDEDEDGGMATSQASSMDVTTENNTAASTSSSSSSSSSKLPVRVKKEKN